MIRINEKILLELNILLENSLYVITSDYTLYADYTMTIFLQLHFSVSKMSYNIFMAILSATIWENP